MSTNNQLEVDALFGGLEPSEHPYLWFVVHTKPRWEKKFAHYCKLHNINYYLPLIDSVRVYHERKVIFKKPLFPGYIFLKCQKEDKSLLFRSGSIVRFISVPAEAELLDDLENIYRSLSADQPIKNHSFVKEGYKVKITGGSFVDVEGVVIDADNPNEVIVGIHIIQQAICVKVDPAHIELISRTVQELD